MYIYLFGGTVETNAYNCISTQLDVIDWEPFKHGGPNQKQQP